MRVGRITIAAQSGSRSIKAEIIGDWAVHRVVDADPLSSCEGYRVSHRQTGMAIAAVADDLSHQDALLIAHSLNENSVKPDDPDFRYIATAVIAGSLSP